MSEVGERELLAIIFTDAVDSTARTASDEDFSLRILLADLEFIRNEAAVRGGTVLKNTGDGLLISFKSAVDAVECSLSIQRGFANRQQTNTFSHKIGLHIGDVIKKDGDIYGSGVNTASRLVAKSPPGGLCMSSTLFELVKQNSAIGSLKVENFQLTNIEPPICAYRLEQSRVASEIIVENASPEKNYNLRKVKPGILMVGFGVLTLGALWFIAAKNSYRDRGWVISSSENSYYYQKIRNLGVGEDLVLNSYNDENGRGKCGLLVNEGSKNESGQLWDLRTVGSFRNQFLGNDREICIDQDGTAFMGRAGQPEGRIKLLHSIVGKSCKIRILGRYLSADPNPLPRKEFRVWASPNDLGKLSEWEIIATSVLLPQNNLAGLPLDDDVAKRLQDLRKRGDNELANRLQEKIKKAWETCQKYPGSHVIVGRLRLADSKKDVRLANAQMEILEEGLFAGEVRDFRNPVSFSLQGYSPNQIRLDGKKGSIVDVGEITLQPLLVKDSASVKLKITGADQARSYTRLELFLEPDSMNTPHNGTSPRPPPGWEPPIEIAPDDNNEILGSNLSPGKYFIKITSPECLDYEKRIVLSPGQKLELGTINLIKKSNQPSMNPQQNP